jgi:hypothetical protein
MRSQALYAISPDWAVVGYQLDELVNGPEFRVLKRSARTLAGVGRVNGSEVFIKRVTTRSWLKGVVSRICGSRARRTMAGSAILRRAGFLHPKLIAAFEQRKGGAVQATYVIVEHLCRPKMLSRFALADGRDFRWRRELTLQLAHTIRNLHDTGCYTLDLQETNLMLETLGANLRIYFTDLEDFRQLPSVPRRLRLVNLIHLDRSIGRFVSRSYRLRFLYDYLGARPERSEARALVAHLHRIHQRIERRNLRRRRSTAIVTPLERSEA